MDIDLGSTWPLVITVFITLLCGFYVWEVAQSYRRRIKIDLSDLEEGFANPDGNTTAAMLDHACYDKFYAKVYDHLVQPAARAGLETKVALEWMEKKGLSLSDTRVADIGCGTGLHVELFARQGVRSVVGYDKSSAMIDEAKKRYPTREFHVGDAADANMSAASQYDLVTMYYFTLYMVPNRTEMLKNIYLWLAPGGVFVAHIVNKLKFDPVLESASPFVGFSVQKYADDRITTSNVTFEEFDYTGDFQLHGSRGMYEETFKFKDGRVRRHEQRVWMPNIDALVDEIGAAGFKYAHHVDMTAIGYEYNYLFFFQK
jgi:ubiquinone/menaquinone biosynthesis C-methylase UbiE